MADLSSRGQLPKIVVYEGNHPQCHTPIIGETWAYWIKSGSLPYETYDPSRITTFPVVSYDPESGVVTTRERIYIRG